jgi:intein/homing endonuclease
MVYGGAKDNDPSADVIVGTFHSLTRKSIDYYKGIDVVCVDECLDGKTKIEMADGTFKPIEDIKIGESVMTMNEKTGEKESDTVEEVYKNMINSASEDMYEIETEDGRILRLTGNHKVMLQDGTWKEVKDLTENDELKEIYKKNSSYYD